MLKQMIKPKSNQACSMLLWNTMAFVVVIFAILFIFYNRTEKPIYNHNQQQSIESTRVPAPAYPSLF